MTPNWFVAWPVTGAAEWVAALERDAPGGLRFLAPRDLHVTLTFLGRYDEALVPKMTALLRGLPLKSVEITPDRLMALPQPRRFSALAFSVTAGRLEIEAQIAKWRTKICREAGAKTDVRPTLPHVTVARPERRIGEADREAALEWMLQMPPQTDIRLRLEMPRLYTWASGAEGARYRFVS